jgi:hypothetical protein
MILEAISGAIPSNVAPVRFALVRSASARTALVRSGPGEIRVNEDRTSQVRRRSPRDPPS